MKITLFARDPVLCEYWERNFSSFNNITVSNIDFNELKGHDCIVSPANSFGYMDGGFDLVLRDYFGISIQQKVQSEIMRLYAGIQPIGTSIIIETGDNKFSYLAHTPTMMFPMTIKGTFNPFFAFRALLLECDKHKKINSIACTGLGAWTGRMTPSNVSNQMRIAYDSVYDPSINMNYYRWLSEYTE